MPTNDGAVPTPGTAGDTAGLGAVLWDMDGTLVDSEKLWDISLTELARHLGGELSPATREAMVGSSMWRTLDMMFDEVRLAHRPEHMEEAARWLSRRTEELFQAGLPWRPGALEALRMVRASGLATALVTSTERALVELALESIGREHFDLVVCGDEVPATKPAPDPYLIAAAKLGMEPARCLVIEDSPTGAASATAAGCPVLVVPNDVPVPAGPGRVQRESLAELTDPELRELWLRAVAGNHWSTESVRSAVPLRDQ
ncbi:MAG TPA: HAD family phosphatase [Pseudonocardia sp.]|uniref:HAD family hydrolase n=1 Tax=Pseudonocardia sp. TaxID=60912 RepID=UPI002B546D76|nr:HAD family phosphatase [Pseudonocardia sp.]HTF51392.1 HAD family phosphatase [Pseudonocardia sp.]